MIVLSLLARVMHAFGMDAFGIPYIGILFKIDETYPYSRLTAFLDYPTLVVPFMLLMIPGALEYVKQKVEDSGKERFTGIVQFFYYGMCGLPIYFSYSRAGYVLYVVGIILLLGYLCGKKLTKKLAITGMVVVCLMMVIIAAATPFPEIILDKLMSMRGGSNSTRMTIYTENIHAFLNHPIIGCGIKEMCEAVIMYPLGSHSTYLGFLYKTGVLGTVCAMSGVVVTIVGLMKSVLKQPNKTFLYSGFVILIFAFAIVEDLDGADWLVCLFFSSFGVPLNKITVVR